MHPLLGGDPSEARCGWPQARLQLQGGKRVELNAAETSVVGAAAGAVTALLTTPLDVVKTRLMTQGSSARYAGIADCVTKIARQEGLGTFFTVWKPPLRLVWHAMCTKSGSGAGHTCLCMPCCPLLCARSGNGHAYVGAAAVCIIAKCAGLGAARALDQHWRLHLLLRPGAGQEGVCAQAGLAHPAAMTAACCYANAVACCDSLQAINPMSPLNACLGTRASIPQEWQRSADVTRQETVPH